MMECLHSDLMIKATSVAVSPQNTFIDALLGIVKTVTVCALFCLRLEGTKKLASNFFRFIRDVDSFEKFEHHMQICSM